MGLRRVNGCCCLTLRTGGLIFGWAGILLASFNIIMIIIRAINIDTTFLDESDENLIGASLGVGICLMDFLICGLTIYGINKDKHLFLLPWLILRALHLVLAFLAIIFAVGVSIFQGQILFEPAFVYSSIFALLIWSWIVIYSLYKEIQIKMKEKSYLPAILSYLESQKGPLDPAPSPYKFIEK